MQDSLVYKILLPDMSWKVKVDKEEYNCWNAGSSFSAELRPEMKLLKILVNDTGLEAFELSVGL